MRTPKIERRLTMTMDELLAINGHEPSPDKMRRAIERAGIPERYIYAAPDYERAQRLKSGLGLWLYGSLGVGKTHTACATAIAWLEKCEGGAAFVSAADVVSGAADVKDYSKVGLLVLDDIGKGMPNDLAVERLFRLVDERYRRLKPMIVTSQYDPVELARRLASRGDSETATAIVWRLRECCTVQEIQGKNWRAV